MTPLFGFKDIIILTSVGIASFAGSYLLEKIERHDLSKVLRTSVEISAILYLLYKFQDFIRIIQQLYGAW